MIDTPKHFLPLTQLYNDMDNDWGRVADLYDFQCTGCTDNCCLSLFFHHTYVEAAFIKHGIKMLSKEEQKKIINNAQNYCTQTFGAGVNGTAPPVSQKSPCPLLLNGQCRLYEFRPMICRMHGLPHELHRPGHGILKGPGCKAGQFERHPYIPFDRTPFYSRMAGIELAFRNLAGKTGKVKKTIAQIIVDPAL